MESKHSYGIQQDLRIDLIGLVAPLLLHCSATGTVVLAAGDYFGENPLLRDEPRSATILAKSEMFTFRPMADGCRWFGGFHSGDQVPKTKVGSWVVGRT